MPINVLKFTFAHCISSRDCILSATSGLRKFLLLCSRECRTAAESVFRDIIISQISELGSSSGLKEKNAPF